MKLALIGNLHYSKRAILGGVLLLTFLTSYWYWLDYKDFLRTPLIVASSESIFEIKKGTGVNRLSHQLAQQGVIKNTLYLRVLGYFNPQLSQLKVGEYQFTTAVTPVQLLEKLNQGQVIQYRFTIIEGQTSYQIIQNLAKESRLEQLSEQQLKQLPNLLNIEQNHLEGWFFPETYSYTKNETILSLLKRAKASMSAALDEEWQNREQGLPYQSAYQALVMASIIEKETGIASERAEIAGVFVRRLRKKMRLGTDPTVIYGIGPGFNGDITYKDLRTPTPYNTYVIKGLPPTPIAMPSRESINAALHPAAGKTLYFVADGTGGHYFSETLVEHNKAVQRMLKRQRAKN